MTYQKKMVIPPDYRFESKTYLPLQKELKLGEIKSALVVHTTQRWYVGELFCHGSWVECFSFAGIKVSFCTNQSYLEIFKEHPNIQELFPVESLSEERLLQYDLVVFVSTHPPTEYKNNIKRAIYSYNKALEYVELGNQIKIVAKSGFNLFRIATHQHGQTALPNGAYYRMWLSPSEKKAAASCINILLGTTERHLIIFNPTASNAYTRRSNREKAVDNTLKLNDCTALVKALLEEFPVDHILIGASLAAGDYENYQLVENLAAHFYDEPRVHSLFKQTSVDKGMSFREFAALLVDPRIEKMIGNSTGSNAHLASTLDIPVMSIERGTDEAMRENWRSPERGQMGSFRWRNPGHKAAAYSLPWDSLNSEQFASIASAFRFHGYAAESKYNLLFGERSAIAIEIAGKIISSIKSISCFDKNIATCLRHLRDFSTLFVEEKMVDFYFNFADEADYLWTMQQPQAASVFSFLDSLRPSKPSDPTLPTKALKFSSTKGLVVYQLICDSNLYKLLNILRKRGENDNSRNAFWT